MKSHLESDAAVALRDTLSQISVIRVKEIHVEPYGRTDKTLIARVDISGHAHVLVCKVAGDCTPAHLHRTYAELRKLIARFPGATTPVLIAPALSDEARAMCSESNTGFLDLEGNARLYLDEVFIVKRSLPHHDRLPSPAETLPTSETARFAQVA